MVNAKLFLLIWATIMFLSGSSYLLGWSLMNESFDFWLIRCAGLTMGMIGIIEVSKELEKEVIKGK